MLRFQQLIQIPNHPSRSTSTTRWRWIVWNLFSVAVGAFYLYIYTIPGLQGQLPGLLLTTLAYGFRAVCIIALALWCFTSIPWRPTTTFERRRGQVLVIVYTLLIILSTILSFTILIDITPYSSIQKLTYYVSLIVFFLQGFMFVRQGMINQGGIVLVLALLIEIFGSVSIASEHRQLIVPFEYVLVVLIGGLLIRWWSGVVLASVLAPFEALLQTIGLVPGIPDLFRTIEFSVFLLTIAALTALYAHSLESALILADERASKLEIALDALTHESAAREHEAAERARVEAYAAQAEQLVAERERSRIASELHDSINYHLATIAQKLDRAQKHLTTKPLITNTEIHETRGLARFALADIRASLHAIRNGSIQPLEDAIQELGSNEIKVRVIVVGESRYLPPEVALAGYRLAQETIANTLKHAQNATSITFTLDYQPQYLALTSEDDGQPRHDPDESTHTKMGLVGLSDRIEYLGGSLQFGPVDTGFRVYAEIPTETTNASYTHLDR